MKTYFSLKDIHQLSQSEENTTNPHELLLNDIKKTQTALENAYLGFDNAIDPDLIDCYIYEINSALKRYRFLIHQAQSMQLCKIHNDYDDFLFTEHKLVSQLCPIPNNLSLNHN